MGKSGVTGLKEPAWPEDLEDGDTAAINYIIVWHRLISLGFTSSPKWQS